LNEMYSRRTVREETTGSSLRGKVSTMIYRTEKERKHERKRIVPESAIRQKEEVSD